MWVYSIIFLNRTPIFDWCVVRWGSRNKHHKDTYLKDIRLCLHGSSTTANSFIELMARSHQPMERQYWLSFWTLVDGITNSKKFPYTTMRCLTASCEPFQKRVTGRLVTDASFLQWNRSNLKSNIVSFWKSSVRNTISEFQVWMHFRWTAIQLSLRWTDTRPSSMMWTGLQLGGPMYRVEGINKHALLITKTKSGRLDPIFADVSL